MPTAKDEAFQRIRDAILAGQLRPGAQLKEQEMAEWCATSRTPVRAALRQLADEGFVTITGTGRTFVTDLTEQELDQAFDIAALLEAYSASLAATRIADTEIEKLEGLATEMERLAVTDLQNYRRFLELNAEFHRTIHLASGNRALFDLIRRVPHVANTQSLRIGNRAATAKSNIEHRSIIQALREHDPDLARLQMQLHTESVRRAMRKLLNAHASAEGDPDA